MQKHPASARVLWILEAAFWAAGVALCTLFLSQVVMGEARRVDGIERAEEAWNSPREPLPADLPLPDQSLWSESRIERYRASLAAGSKPVLAVLELPDLSLKAPVYEGELERGPGWIAGTARPGEAGNVGIAGHRDGYFRVLKGARLGDTVSLRTAAGRENYVIEDILIVDPVDVDVLAPTGEPTLTLVTCYPFYFVGSAPQRYIVRARLDMTQPVPPARAGTSHTEEI